MAPYVYQVGVGRKGRKKKILGKRREKIREKNEYQSDKDKYTQK